MGIFLTAAIGFVTIGAFQVILLTIGHIIKDRMDRED